MNRYTYIFEDSINTETVQRLINDIHGYEKVDLFFTTDGGYIFNADILVHYLNSRQDDITVYFAEQIQSAGVMVMCDFKGNKVIHNSLEFIMAHKIDHESYNFRKSDFDDKRRLKGTKEENIKLAEKLRELGFTEKELKKFNSGRDVILYKDDFKRLKV